MDLAPRRPRRTVIQWATVLSASIISAALCLLVATPPASAQSTQSSAMSPASVTTLAPKPAAATRIDVSPQAAGIDRIVAADLRSDGWVSVSARQTTEPPKKKSVWKTPWPYVVIGAGAALAV